MSQRFLLGIMCASALVPAPSPTALVLSPLALPGGKVGVAYSQTFTVTGASGAVSYAVASGSLPGGLSLNLSSGELSGMPTTAGTYTFEITATDAGSNTGTRRYSIEVVTGWGLGSVYSAVAPYAPGSLGSQTPENFIVDRHAALGEYPTITYTGQAIRVSGRASGTALLHAPQNGVWRLTYHSASTGNQMRYTIKRIA